MQKGKLFLEFRKDISPCQGSEMGTRGWTPASAQKRCVWLSYDSREPMKELGRVKGRTPSVFRVCLSRTSLPDSGQLADSFRNCLCLLESCRLSSISTVDLD